MALREWSALCVPMRVTWGRHSRGNAPMSIYVEKGHVTYEVHVNKRGVNHRRPPLRVIYALA